MPAVFHQDGSSTPPAFQEFLSWLDEGTNSDGARYLEMRRRLVHYFDRKNCSNADDLADETLQRVARRLEEEGGLTASAPARYCYIVAKFVFLEFRRRQDASLVPFDEVNPACKVMPLLTPEPRAGGEMPVEERRHECLECCLGKLDADSQWLIVEYYQGEGGAKIDNRRRLAERLNTTVNAVSIRACRIREKLEGCVRHCLVER